MLFLLPVLATVLQATAPGAPPQGEKAPEKAPAAGRLLLRGATVHTLVPGEAPRVADVRIEGGHVRALGEGLAAAEGERVLDLSGKHLVPGLIDACVNFDPEHDALYLAAGITLVRDLGGDHAALALAREQPRRDRVPGPTLLSAGAALDGDPPATPLAVVLRNADAAKDYLPILFEEGVDFLSLLPGLPAEARTKAIELAHEKELRADGPRPPGLALASAIEQGQDGFHGLDALLPVGVLWDAVQPPALDASVAALAAARRSLVPLFRASTLRLEDQDAETPVAQLLALLGPTYESWWRAELAGRRPFLQPESLRLGTAVVQKQGRALKSLFDSGVKLLPGSGAPQPWLFPGRALHEELAQWVRAGIPTAAVLDLATRGAAEALGLAGQRGTIQAEAWADLLVLERDPTEDLAALLDPAWVVVRGLPVSRAEIQARLADLGERQRAVRVELAKPVQVAEPPQGEAGRVLLEGQVESFAFGARVSSERYRVVELEKGGRLYSARILYPPSAGSGGRELTLEQFVRANRLEQAHLALKEGGSVLEHDGLWTASTWRMQTRLDGQVVSTPKPLREQPVCIEVGSVTALLVLAQAPLGAQHPVVQMHPAFDAELVYWRTELDDHGDHQVRTHVGFKAFRLDGRGGLEFALGQVGASTVETRSLSSAGPGLPLPADKLARQKAVAPVEGTAGAKSGG